MEEHVYRFRPTSALLGEFHELQNQEMYFSSLQELNDPLEGFKEIFWRGDEIVWTNLIRHYLLCLTQSVLAAIVCGPNHEFHEHEIPVFQTEDGLPSSIRSLFHVICTKFFQNDEVGALPALLAARNSSVKRNQLLSLLWSLHFYALKVICTVISPQTPVCEIDGILRARPDGPFRFQQLFSAQDSVGQEHGKNVDLVEQLSSCAVNAIHQTIIISAYNDKSQYHGLAWKAISSGFPGAYINQIEKLLHFDWYTACFVGEPTNAAMWGNYGDRHRGACLKFKTGLNAAGKSSIFLETADKDSASRAAANRVHRDPH